MSLPRTQSGLDVGVLSWLTEFPFYLFPHRLVAQAALPSKKRKEAERKEKEAREKAAAAAFGPSGATTLPSHANTSAEEKEKEKSRLFGHAHKKKHEEAKL